MEGERMERRRRQDVERRFMNEICRETGGEDRYAILQAIPSFKNIYFFLFHQVSG